MSNPITLSVQSQSPIVLEMGFNFVAQVAGVGGGSGITFFRDTLNFAQYPTFTQSGSAVDVVTSSLFVNGQKQVYGTDYNIVSSTLNWVGTAIAFPVTAIEVYYRQSMDGGAFYRDLLNFAQYPTFTLSAVVTAASTSSLFVNGQKQTFGIDYSVSGSTLTWIGTAISFPVTAMEFYYQ